MNSPNISLQFPRKIAVPPIFLAGLTGVLLVLCFPKTNWGFLGWIALLPLMAGIYRSKSMVHALGCGLFAGLVFYGISMSWLNYVSVFGWFFLGFFESIFLVLFAAAVFYGRQFKSAPVRMIWNALAWTTFELVRSELPIAGLGWNLLAHSQTFHPLILQSANTFGVYGISFILAFTNAGFLEVVRVFLTKDVQLAGRIRAALLPLVLVFLTFVMVVGHGLFHYNRKETAQQSLRIAVIQGNIPQSVKWEPMARSKIIDLYSLLTRLASFDQPDLIVWPESSFPGYFNRDLEALPIRALTKELGIPLVVGSPYLEGRDEGYNSAYLLDAKGEIVDRYNKMYLVPFGEYVPLKPLFGFLEPLAYSLGVSDFKAGDEWTVMRAPGSEIPFGVLICFEDVFPVLARNFVKRGAEFLTVITNDAWFGPTGAPYQHLQASVFRAVENGVPVVRAANTGVSAFISHKGDILARVKADDGKDIYISGRHTLEVHTGFGPTFFQQGGWLFPYIAAAAFVIMFFISSYIFRGKNSGHA